MLKRLRLTYGLLVFVLVPAAFAGQPGVNATVSASTNPIVLDAPFTWSGCGYTPGQELRLQMSGLTTTGEYEFGDASGCFVSTVWMLPSIYYSVGGVETATVYKVSPTSGKSQKALASVSVQVVAAP